MGQDSLEKIFSDHPIPITDSIWTPLLTISTPLSRYDPVEIEQSVLSSLSSLVYHNASTHNCQRLLYLTTQQLLRADTPTMGSANLIFITRCILKELIEQLTPQQLSAFITIPPALRSSPAVTPTATATSPISPTSPTNDNSDEFSDLGDHSLVEALTRATLTALSTPLPPTTTSPSYLFQLESSRLLLVLASSQLYSPTAHLQPTGTSPFLDTAMQAAADLAPVAVAGLLHRIIVDPMPPLSLHLHVTTTYTQAVYQVVRSAASTVWWIPYQAYSYVLKPKGDDNCNNNNKPGEGALAEACLLALLALVFHAPAAPLQQQGMMNAGAAGVGAYPRVSNPFKLALRQLKDADDVGSQSAAEDGRAPPTRTGTTSVVQDGRSTDTSNTDPTATMPTVSFGALYTALGRSLKGEAGVLLCYALLHRNATFQEFCLARSDIELLLMPLLEALYRAPEQSAKQLYMLLIIILMLSQDSAFAQNVHRVSIPSVPFYKEKIINKTTLGSLLVLLLLRTAHHNLATMKDVYLHTNTLAALANLAPYVSGLSSHASQRIVSLFAMLAKRYNRLVLQQQSTSQQEQEQQDDQEKRESKELEIQLYADFLRIVLEIINSILSNALQQNPELIYMLLQQAEVFEPWSSHPRYAELMINITTVISFFNKKLQDPVVADQIGHGTLVMTTNNNSTLPQLLNKDTTKDTQQQQQAVIMTSAKKVLEAIKLATRGWRSEKLRPIPELRFNYEEEANPEEFFVPYVWGLIIARGGVPFRLKAISLFRSGGDGEGD